MTFRDLTQLSGKITPTPSRSPLTSHPLLLHHFYTTQQIAQQQRNRKRSQEPMGHTKHTDARQGKSRGRRIDEIPHERPGCQSLGTHNHRPSTVTRATNPTSRQQRIRKQNHNSANHDSTSEELCSYIAREKGENGLFIRKSVSARRLGDNKLGREGPSRQVAALGQKKPQRPHDQSILELFLNINLNSAELQKAAVRLSPVKSHRFSKLLQAVKGDRDKSRRKGEMGGAGDTIRLRDEAYKLYYELTESEEEWGLAEWENHRLKDEV
ncbi:hypothetical protein BGX38DRAFT_1275124 [Terfezia claveryi]|nr:hypothetical protein BGX38DRAFT_1275124 [Terfezia claveryi]